MSENNLYDLGEVLRNFEDGIKRATFDQVWAETCCLSNQGGITDEESRLLSFIESKENPYLANLYNIMYVCRHWHIECEKELKKLYQNK